MNNKQTNLIHREFTTALTTKCFTDIPLTHEEKIEIKLSQYNFNYDDHILRSFINQNYKIDYSGFDKNVSHLLENINAYIHKYEGSFLSKRARVLRGSFAKGGVFCIKSQDDVTDLHKIDYNMEDLSNDYGNLDPQYNVYDLKCITGKDYYRAWIDYDDPSEWDVVNNNHTTKGGFEIAPWTSHLYHTYIVPWVKHYNMPHEDKYIAPVPIGTADKSTIDLFRQAGKVLWSGEFEVSSKEFFEEFLMKEMDLV